MKHIFLTLLILAGTSLGIADSTGTILGSFVLNVGGPSHPVPLNGTIEMTFAAGQIQLVKNTTALPVVGKTAFESKEQFYNTLVRPGVATQASLIYNLKAVPHKWFFVAVANAQADGKTYAGTIYKVLATPDQIKTILAAGVDAAPTGWKALGTISLNMN